MKKILLLVLVVAGVFMAGCECMHAKNWGPGLMHWSGPEQAPSK